MSPAAARPGRDRPRSAYVWPRSLLRTADDVRIVYLDLNHWIELAKANTGHPDGVRFQPALEAIRSANELFVFPLSSVNYMEMAGIRDPRQRLDVATVMEELSGFSCLIGGATVMRLEIEAVFTQRLGRPEQLPPIPLLGRGVLQAFGRRGGLQVRTEDGQDATEAARRAWPQGPEAFDAWREEAERRLDRSVLRGPSDAEAPALRARGWDPTASRRVATERAKQEAELDVRLALEPRWRRGRLRDVIAARYVAFEAMHALSEAVAQRGVSLQDVFGARGDRGALVHRCDAERRCAHLVADCGSQQSATALAAERHLLRRRAERRGRSTRTSSSPSVTPPMSCDPAASLTASRPTSSRRSMTSPRSSRPDRGLAASRHCDRPVPELLISRAVGPSARVGPPSNSTVISKQWPERVTPVRTKRSPRYLSGSLDERL